MKTIIVTGATQGLGLEIARRLAQDRAHRIVLAVRDVTRGAAVAAAIGGNASVRALDCASQASVRTFAAGWEGPIAGLVNNAGVQHTGATRFGQDGWEETIAVNHLAALRLTVDLLPSLRGGRVLFMGSGTHNPTNWSARLFGFRGARFTSIAALARGDADATNDRQRGMDRYATSKMLNMVTAMELARRIPASRTLFVTLDPGLMAGTGLARDQPAALQFAWRHVLPWVAPLLPDTSTPERSAAAAAWLLTAQEPFAYAGETFSFDRRPSTRVWSAARDPGLGRAVVDESLEFLGCQLPREESHGNLMA